MVLVSGSFGESSCSLRARVAGHGARQRLEGAQRALKAALSVQISILSRWAFTYCNVKTNLIRKTLKQKYYN
jgi:hypothetical protein